MELKDKLNGVLTKGKEAVDKAKDLAEISSLKSQMATCEEVRKKNFLEIGKLYYELHGKAAEEPFDKHCTAISHAEKAIEELQKQIDKLKE